MLCMTQRSMNQLSTSDMKHLSKYNTTITSDVLLWDSYLRHEMMLGDTMFHHSGLYSMEIKNESSIPKSTSNLKHRMLTCSVVLLNLKHRMTAAVGITAEGGEFTEIVKKIVFQGKPYDDSNIEHMKIELGDVLWYVAQACMALDVTFEDLMEMNFKKLSKRYPEGTFDVYRSENRAEEIDKYSCVLLTYSNGNECKGNCQTREWIKSFL